MGVSGWLVVGVSGLMVVFIPISLMANNVGHLFMFLLATCISFFGEISIGNPLPILNGLFGFFIAELLELLKNIF